jgi:hypothetical protein
MGKIDHRNGGSLEWVANLEPPGNFAFTVVLGEVLNRQLELSRRMRKIDGTSRAKPMLSSSHHWY